MKKLTTSLAILVVAAVSGVAQAQTPYLTIGTAGTSGALYPMGVSIAQTVNRHMEGVRASAEATGGSLDNLRKLHQGELEWGISSNEVAYQAYHGEGLYEGREIGNLRSLFGTIASWTQVFTAADSDINSIEDFAGKRIGVGAPGSAGEQTAQMLIGQHGLSYEDINEEFMSDAEMATALQDGHLDAFIVTHPLRSAPLLNLTTSFDARLIPIDSNAFYEAYPFYQKMEIPENTYPNIDEPVYTPVSRIVMYTTTDTGFDDLEVYNLIKTVWENAEEWQDVHASVKSSTTLDQVLDGLGGVPLHPGAARYYEEQGFEINDALK